MTMVQMNVRIDADLKRRGDEVLKEKGITPSVAVREWYEELIGGGGDHENTNESAGLPGDGVAAGAGAPALDDNAAAKRRKLAALDELCGCLERAEAELIRAGLRPRDDVKPLSAMTPAEIKEFEAEERYQDYLYLAEHGRKRPW